MFDFRFLWYGTARKEEYCIPTILSYNESKMPELEGGRHAGKGILRAPS
jgi:hypothetical protein